MAVDYAIHNESRKGNKNIHAHILCIMRPINEKGEFTAKSKKKYILDDNGEKILNKNGKPKSRKKELITWNDKGNAENGDSLLLIFVMNIIDEILLMKK